MKPVIVIGMHRSGTSLMVKILEQLGVFMGADQEYNNESIFFIWMNKWILKQANTSWDNIGNYQYLSDEAKKTLITILKSRISSYHKKKYFGKNMKHCSFFNSDFLWGWKDPRNTITIDIWKKIFKSVKIIHIYRNPIDVINSLNKREECIKTNVENPSGTGIKKKLFGLKLPQSTLFDQSFRCLDYTGGFSLWKEYVTRAFSISDDSLEIHHVSFEELISTPDKIITKLSEFLELSNNPIPTKEFIDPKRKLTFLNNPELMDFYNKIKDDELVKKLNYGHIE